MNNRDLKIIFTALKDHVETSYGIFLSDQPWYQTEAPEGQKSAGTLDGKYIYVGNERHDNMEFAFLNFFHLMGHTIQWHLPDCFRYAYQGQSLSARQFGLLDHRGLSVQPESEVYRYEMDAWQISLGILADSGILQRHPGLDRWISQRAAGDLAYLDDLYGGRETRPHAEYLPKFFPLLKPLCPPKPGEFRACVLGESRAAFTKATPEP